MIKKSILFIFFIQMVYANHWIPSGELPRIFLNCATGCDESYIKFELSSFTFARDRFVSDIEIYLVAKQSGNGGSLHQVQFIGRNRYEGISDTINYLVNSFDTEDNKRTKFLKVIELGLLKFINKDDLLNLVNISLNKVDTTRKKAANDDKWNSFIFNIGSAIKANGESNYQNTELWQWTGIDRVTEKSALGIWTEFNFKNSVVKTGGETYSATTYETKVSSKYVKAINQHWSFGGMYRFRNSVFLNFKSLNRVAPVIEYNIFPYSESLRRQFRFAYQSGVTHYVYNKETILNQTSELRFYHKVSALIDYNQPWGTIRTGVHASSFVPVIQQYRLTVSNNIELKLIKGLYLGFFGSASVINDQISLPKQEADVENALLKGQQLPTSFAYDGYFELNYTFGSLNNSIVNQRMANVD
ncbi:MAG: hypothetical protein SFY32_04420 [Bacteroidota bacterium]|nr:hypothetical protein [Bacteroidota bacterium]